MPATVQAHADSPQAAGYLTRAIKSLWGRMTPEERATTLQDAATASALELGKATDLLEQGDDHERPGKVEDLFDGPPDDRLRTVSSGGPDGSVAPGEVGVGKPQEASGRGAASMEREYSRHASQTGVQRATEELGAKLAGHARAMKALVAFGKAMGDRLALVETAMASTALTPDAKAVEAMVAAALAKAVPAAVALALSKAIPAVVKAVAKAKKDGEGEKDDEKEGESGEEDEEEGEEEDSEAEQAESGSGPEIEIVNENEEEGEDEAESDEDDTKKAARKAAAQQRLTAKALIRLAKAAERDSREAMEEERSKAAFRQYKCAKSRLMKARLHVSVAKALRDGKAGPSMKAIEKSIASLGKALKEARAKNQDKWPVGKGTPVAAAAAAPVQAQGPDMTAAVKAMTEAVEKANAGYALLTTNVQGLMAAVAGQSRDPAADGKPPVTALFKATPPGKEAELNRLLQEGAITAQERDKGIDALGYQRVSGVPEGLVKAAVDACAPSVQAVLRAAA